MLRDLPSFRMALAGHAPANNSLEPPRCGILNRPHPCADEFLQQLARALCAEAVPSGAPVGGGVGQPSLVTAEHGAHAASAATGAVRTAGGDSEAATEQAASQAASQGALSDLVRSMVPCAEPSDSHPAQQFELAMLQRTGLPPTSPQAPQPGGPQQEQQQPQQQQQEQQQEQPQQRQQQQQSTHAVQLCQQPQQQPAQLQSSVGLPSPAAQTPTTPIIAAASTSWIEPVPEAVVKSAAAATTAAA